MTTVFLAGLLMGSLGSVHCIGMCGPIALSLPVVQENPFSKFIGTLLYNAGRVATYASLGAIFGMVGQGFSFFGLQQWLSISLGILILVFLVVPTGRIMRGNPGGNFFIQLRTKLAAFFAQRNYHSLFSIGLLNGLLPCGMIYMAIAAALSTATVAKSSLFMTGFGLGTFPVMWSLSFFGSFISLQVRHKIKKLYPYIMFAMGALLIMRGMGLDIPYLSPGNNGVNVGNTAAAINCHD